MYEIKLIRNSFEMKLKISNKNMALNIYQVVPPDAHFALVDAGERF